MSQVENTTSETVVDSVVDTAVEAKVPTVSKKSQAHKIFLTHLALRGQGAYTTNHQFRQAVLNEIREQLGVSVASAATMYNSSRQTAQAEDAQLNLGRDPRREPAKKTPGVRGRPRRSPVVIQIDAAEPAETVATETQPADAPVADPVA